MSVPVPITLTLNPPKLGWTTTSPNKYADLVQLVAQNLQGSMDVELLTGQIGGSKPSNPLPGHGGVAGPWLNGNEWYVWGSHGYQPSQQGAPVGTVAMWGGSYNTPVYPQDWLFCDGSSQSTTQYPTLFNAIGYTWGGSGGTFKLPPGATFYFNCAGAWMDPLALPPNGGAIHAGQSGGALAQKLLAANMPRLKITIPYLYPVIIDGGGINVPDITWQPGSSPSPYDYPVQQEFGPPIGANQQSIATLPPYVSIFYIIKYQ